MRNALLAIVAAPVLLVAGHASADPILVLQEGWEVVDLSTPTGKTSYALGINASGQCAGADKPTGSTTELRAVIWSATGQASYPSPSFQMAQAIGVTSTGEAIGYGKMGGIYGGFKNDKLIDYGKLPMGVGANNRLVGMKESNNHVLAWSDPAATMKMPSGYSEAWAWDSNGGGATVGYAATSSAQGSPTRPIRWHANGDAVNLPGKGPGEHGGAFSINNAGVVVGHVGDDPSTHAAKWVNDQLTELPALSGASGTTAINNGGTIVGWAKDSNGNMHGVFWKADKLSDINAHIDRPSLARPAMTTIQRAAAVKAEWYVEEISAINDKNEMCGYATKNGVTHAVLLKPVFRKIDVATLEEIAALVTAAKPMNAVILRRHH